MGSFTEEVGLESEGKIKEKQKKMKHFATFIIWRLFFKRKVLSELILWKNLSEMHCTPSGSSSSGFSKVTLPSVLFSSRLFHKVLLRALKLLLDPMWLYQLKIFTAPHWFQGKIQTHTCSFHGHAHTSIPTSPFLEPCSLLSALNNTSSHPHYLPYPRKTRVTPKHPSGLHLKIIASRN